MGDIGVGKFCQQGVGHLQRLVWLLAKTISGAIPYVKTLLFTCAPYFGFLFSLKANMGLNQMMLGQQMLLN